MAVVGRLRLLRVTHQGAAPIDRWRSLVPTAGLLLVVKIDLLQVVISRSSLSSDQQRRQRWNVMVVSGLCKPEAVWRRTKLAWLAMIWSPSTSYSRHVRTDRHRPTDTRRRAPTVPSTARRAVLSLSLSLSLSAIPVRNAGAGSCIATCSHYRHRLTDLPRRWKAPDVSHSPFMEAARFT